ncbi:MAG: ComF family protein [Epsilonproteobacteria bacterium]|nr:ComF family protein [Campylobacterota bacterium]
MYCLLCGGFSYSHICKDCQDSLLKPSVTKRVLSDSLEVYSFYKYSHIKELVLTKHKDIGYFVYNILAKRTFKEFAKNFSYKQKVYSIAIDDNPKDGYSHTAILNKHLKSKYIKPVFSKLRAQNSVSYSGKSLDFRLNNPRDFKYDFKRDIEVILVDDIITTGTTLKEASKVLENEGIRVLFALTLADARDT